jgi:hypothetical protein
VNTCTADCHTALGNSKRHAHCVACHASFTTVSTFDRHQTGYDPVTCLDPTTVGLERKPSGLWGAPPPENPYWAVDTEQPPVRRSVDFSGVFGARPTTDIPPALENPL